MLWEGRLRLHCLCSLRSHRALTTSGVAPPSERTAYRSLAPPRACRRAPACHRHRMADGFEPCAGPCAMTCSCTSSRHRGKRRLESGVSPQPKISAKYYFEFSKTFKTFFLLNLELLPLKNGLLKRCGGLPTKIVQKCALAATFGQIVFCFIIFSVGCFEGVNFVMGAGWFHF